MQRSDEDVKPAIIDAIVLRLARKRVRRIVEVTIILASHDFINYWVTLLTPITQAKRKGKPITLTE